MKKYSLFFRRVIFPVIEIAYRTNIMRDMDFLKQSQHFSKKEMTVYQEKQLKNIIAHTYSNVPYYKELFDNLNLKPSDIKSKKDLSKIPFLTKSIVRENLDKLRATNYRNKSYPKSTSGSTGQPTIFYQTKEDFSWIWAAHFRAWEWAGYTPGDRYVKLSITDENKSLKKKIQNFLFRCKFIRVYDMSEENIQNYVKKIISFRPVLIYGYSSSLNAIAEYMNKKGIKYETKAIITTGDKLMPNYYKNIKSAFCCSIYDEFGCGGEGLYIAAQCEKGNYHISDELMIVEENKGEIVITSLNNYAMPLIRYKSGDNVKLDGGCSCGKGLSMIESLKGRTNEFIRTRAGVMLNSQFFEYIMEVLPGVLQFKIVQIDYDNIDIQLLCNDEYKKTESEKRIKNYITKSAGVKLNINYIYVDHFNPNGHKFKTIESRII